MRVGEHLTGRAALPRPIRATAGSRAPAGRSGRDPRPTPTPSTRHAAERVARCRSDATRRRTRRRCRRARRARGAGCGQLGRARRGGDGSEPAQAHERRASAKPPVVQPRELGRSRDENEGGEAVTRDHDSAQCRARAGQVQSQPARRKVARLVRVSRDASLGATAGDAFSCRASFRVLPTSTIRVGKTRQIQAPVTPDQNRAPVIPLLPLLRLHRFELDARHRGLCARMCRSDPLRADDRRARTARSNPLLSPALADSVPDLEYTYIGSTTSGPTRTTNDESTKAAS